VTDEVSSQLFPDPDTRPTYWAGICNAGVYRQSPFHIVHAGRGHLKFGVVGPRPTDDYDPDPRKTQLGNPMVAQLLSSRLLEPYLLSPERTTQAQLLKLVINSVINPLTAAFHRKNGALLDLSYEPIMQFLVKEAGAIVRALLPDMPAKDVYSDMVLNRAVLEVAKLTAQNTSSMLQDVQAGRPTEIDYINGYFVAQGKKLGLPWKYHAEMVERVKSMEGRRPPSI
jgi:2-dehydropantoate 2-reductase